MRGRRLKRRQAVSTITTQDGTQIYYKDWGTGQPVVFSHGWPLSADAWESQMVYLASNGYRCIALVGGFAAERGHECACDHSRLGKHRPPSRRGGTAGAQSNGERRQFSGSS